jgi:hypothetical protein
MAIDPNAGYGMSSKLQFVIPNGATGVAVDAVDLGRHYAWVIIRITSATGIAAAATLAVHLGMEAADTPIVLSDDNLPLTADAIGHHLLFVGGARRVRLVLSAVTTGEVTIDIWGADAAVAQ